VAIDPKQYPECWLQPGEEWVGQKNGLPRPGTPESAEYHRKAWDEEAGRSRLQPPAAPSSKPKPNVSPEEIERLKASGLPGLRKLIELGVVAPGGTITMSRPSSRPKLPSDSEL
jgi:hypothetical protein